MTHTTASRFDARAAACKHEESSTQLERSLPPSYQTRLSAAARRRNCFHVLGKESRNLINTAVQNFNLFPRGLPRGREQPMTDLRNACVSVARPATLVCGELLVCAQQRRSANKLLVSVELRDVATTGGTITTTPTKSSHESQFCSPVVLSIIPCVKSPLLIARGESLATVRLRPPPSKRGNLIPLS